MGRWKKKSIYTVIKRFRKRLAIDFYYTILECNDFLKLTKLNNMLIEKEVNQNEKDRIFEGIKRNYRMVHK